MLKPRTLRLTVGQQDQGSFGLQVLQSLSLSGGTKTWVAPAQFGFIGHLGSACRGSQAAPPLPGKHPLSLTHRELGPSWDRKASRGWGCFGAFPLEVRPSCFQLGKPGASLTTQEDEAHKQDKRQMGAWGGGWSHRPLHSQGAYAPLHKVDTFGEVTSTLKAFSSLWKIRGKSFPSTTLTEHFCSSERWTM